MASAPGPLRVGAALSWRLLVVAAAIALVAYLAARLRVVIIPAFVAALITTLLYPLADALRAWRVPRTLASVLAFTAGLLVLVGTAAAILPPVIDDLADVDGLQADVESGIDRARDWLVQGPLQLSAEEVDRYLDRGLAELQANAQRFAGGAVTGALLVVELFAGAALTVVLTFFFVKDGERFWEWFIRLFDRDMQSDVRAVGERVWRMMTGYVRGTLGVAAVDAVFIGLALLLIGVPFVVPLAVLIFIGGLIPIVGAFATG
ncbi:MAG: AI-2E family transporter, partial [Dehalococcoidia bacterium]